MRFTTMPRYTKMRMWHSSVGVLLHALAVWALWGGGMVIQGTVFMEDTYKVLYAMVLGRMVGYCACCSIGLCVECCREAACIDNDVEHERERGDATIPMTRKRCLAWSVLLEGLALAGFVCYNLLSKSNDGNVALASTLVSLSVYVPVIVGRFGLKERMSWLQAAGVALAVASGLMLSLSDVDTQQKRTHLQGGWYVAGAFVSWGGSYSIAAAIHQAAPLGLIARMQLVAASVIALAYSLALRTPSSIFWNADFCMLLLAQTMTVCGLLVFTRMASLCGAARASTLSAGYTVVPVVVGISVFQNRTSAWSEAGIACALLALCLVSRGKYSSPTPQSHGAHVPAPPFRSTA